MVAGRKRLVDGTRRLNFIHFGQIGQNVQVKYAAVRSMAEIILRALSSVLRVSACR